MTTIFTQLRESGAFDKQLNTSSSSNSTFKKRPLPLAQRPEMYRTKYKSLPVSVPPNFLSPLSPSSVQDLRVEKINFACSVLPEYKDHYAVIIDGLFDGKECEELVKHAEMSAGGHGNGGGEGLSSFKALQSKSDEPAGISAGSQMKENGWHRALVRAGVNREVLSLQHRDSDRIIWQHQEVATRIWERVMQTPGLSEDLSVLEGERYRLVMDEGAVEREERWRLSERGCNESLKFLRYGKGQFFREHCDGTYETADGTERSFYTIHLYLNDSVAISNPPAEPELISLDLDGPGAEDSNPGGDSADAEDVMLEGGATTFHSRDLRFRLDVHPKAGRVLIFQQKGLLHSGDDVVKGVKYTMRSDIMYGFDDSGEGEEGDVVFG